MARRWSRRERSRGNANLGSVTRPCRGCSPWICKTCSRSRPARPRKVAPAGQAATATCSCHWLATGAWKWHWPALAAAAPVPWPSSRPSHDGQGVAARQGRAVPPGLQLRSSSSLTNNFPVNQGVSIPSISPSTIVAKVRMDWVIRRVPPRANL